MLQAVTGVLLVWAGLVLSQETLLAPLNKENIALSQVIFLPPGAPAGFSQPEGRSQHSSNEEEISSREDTMRSGLTDPAAPAEDQDHVMTGSYAYVSGGLTHIIHWTMLSDGGFLFSPSQLLTDQQYGALAQYYDYHDYQYHYDYYQYEEEEEEDDTAQVPMTEDLPYDPYDELFTVSGYDLPAFENEVYDSENLSYNIVRY